MVASHPSPHQHLIHGAASGRWGRTGCWHVSCPWKQTGTRHMPECRSHIFRPLDQIRGGAPYPRIHTISLARAWKLLGSYAFMRLRLNTGGRATMRRALNPVHSRWSAIPAASGLSPRPPGFDAFNYYSPRRFTAETTLSLASLESKTRYSWKYCGSVDTISPSRYATMLVS